MGRRLTGSQCSHGAPNTHSVSPNTDRSGAAHHPLPPYRRGGRRRQRRRGRAAGRSGSRPRASSGRASPAAGRGQSRGEAEGPGAVSAAIPGPGWGEPSEGCLLGGAGGSGREQARPVAGSRCRQHQAHVAVPESRLGMPSTTAPVTEKSLRARRVRGASHALTHTTPQADAALGRSRWGLKARPEGARQPAAKPGRGSRPRTATAAARRLPRGFATRVRVAYVLGAQRTPA